MIDFIFYFSVGLAIGNLLDLVIQHVLVCLRRARDMSDIKTDGTCLDCDHYCECDVFCYYADPEDSDDEETEV